MHTAQYRGQEWFQRSGSKPDQNTDNSGYDNSKITKTLAKELGKKGITMKEKIPLNRLAEPIDIAYAYLYLASAEARYVNGGVLSVDGGLTM